MTIPTLLLLLLLPAAPGHKQPTPSQQDIGTGFLVELDCATITAQHVLHDSKCLQAHINKHPRFGILLANYTWYTLEDAGTDKGLPLIPFLTRDLRVTVIGTLIAYPDSHGIRKGRFAVSSLTVIHPAGGQPESPR